MGKVGAVAQEEKQNAVKAASKDQKLTAFVELRAVTQAE